VRRRPVLIRGSLAMLFGDAISGKIARYLTRATPDGFPKNDFHQNRAYTVDAPPCFPPAARTPPGRSGQK
jgi:hypothetical protein